MTTPEETNIGNASNSFMTLQKDGITLLNLLTDGTLIVNESTGFTLNESAKLFFEELSRLVVNRKEYVIEGHKE